MSRRIPTAEFASLVYGPGGVAADDPAETFHESSRIYPNVAPGRLAALQELSRRPELQETVSRSSRIRPGGAAVALDARQLPALLRRRRSSASLERAPLGLRELAAVLHEAYGTFEREPGVVRRPVPSAGALYPLELYLLPLAVEGLEHAAYHYDPFHHRLERLRAVDEADVAASLVDPALAHAASALIVVTAAFWRSRFKYGLRGYRFSLIEAGHAVQNAVLAATRLHLHALPLGGFYDRRVDALVGADGLDEATVYGVLVGGRA